LKNKQSKSQFIHIKNSFFLFLYKKLNKKSIFETKCSFFFKFLVLLTQISYLCVIN